jgi:hypothetical protein
MVPPWRLRVGLGSPAQQLLDVVEALRLRGEPVPDVDQYVQKARQVASVKRARAALPAKA